MAAISPDNFDPLRRYIDVRLQMGVPLVDRDWNELTDMRRFELRALLKWFVGNGVPAGSSAFLIEGQGAVDDFVIRAGASVPAAALLSGLPDQRSRNIVIALGAGRCLVDGLEVLLEQDVNFAQQPLHVSQPGSAALAASLHVPRVQMPAPAAGTVVAYLDVWEHAVVPNDDPDNMILPDLGIESCARIKREWVVRVRTGTSIPAPGNSDYLIGHSYSALATIVRRVGNGAVQAADVTDIRQTRLTLAELERRMRVLEDLVLVPAFNPSPNQFTPKVGTSGVNVTLFGRNFNVATPAVRFGNVVATIVGTPTVTQIMAQVPNIPPGPVKITVITSGGMDTSDDDFTVLPPPPPSFAESPNQFNPKTGSAETNVLLFGNNFNLGTVTVQFVPVTGPAPNGNANIVGTPTATQIVTTVPTGVTGIVRIRVQTSGGSVVSDDTFTVQ